RHLPVTVVPACSFFFQAEDGIRAFHVTGVQTCALPIYNTAYAAEALLELWCMTKEDPYLRLSELCMANLLRNTALWEQKYGNAAAYPTFFMLFPLRDAPYAALFEEQECLASFNRYLACAVETYAPIAKEILALLLDYCKYALHRLPYS